MKADFSLRRRRLALIGLVPPAATLTAMLTATLPVLAQSASCADLTDWTRFAARHIQADGRVVDFDTPQQQSTSEGQSYALFFSLAHNDRAMFARVLAWTETNLTGGGLAKRLPAWQWGRKPDGGWGVLDPNPASDSDLWIAYSLLEAGRLWNEPRYAVLGRAVLSMAARDEVIALPGLGRMLLPWPRSVATGPNWRLNPSYLPLQLLRRFALEDPTGPWNEIADNTVRMIGAVAPQGFAPDWCAWSSEQKVFVADPEKGFIGSYDAIRVYLWAGMLSQQEPARRPLLASLYGPRRRAEQSLPTAEYVDTASGVASGNGPAGFGGALLPYLKAQELAPAVAAQLARITARAATRVPIPYYERMLLLFGRGWLDGRFAFARNGQLQTNWRPACPSAKSV